MGLLDWLRRRRQRHRDPSSNEADTRQSIFFEGGTGESVELAIVVRGAQYDLEGTVAEFAWLSQKYGQKGTDWKLIWQSHGIHDARDIDTFQIELADGTPLTVFFDCTESFGKWPPPPSGSVRTGRQRRPDDTLP